MDKTLGYLVYGLYRLFELFIKGSIWAYRGIIQLIVQKVRTRLEKIEEIISKTFENSSIT